jgi:hypothetical protein
MSKCELVQLFVRASPLPVTPREVWAAIGFRPHGFLDHLVKQGRIFRVASHMHMGRVGYGSERHEARYWHHKHEPKSSYRLVRRSRALTAMLIFMDPRNPRAMPEWMYQPEIACMVLEYFNWEGMAEFRCRDKG